MYILYIVIRDIIMHILLYTRILYEIRSVVVIRYRAEKAGNIVYYNIIYILFYTLCYGRLAPNRFVRYLRRCPIVVGWTDGGGGLVETNTYYKKLN